MYRYRVYVPVEQVLITSTCTVPVVEYVIIYCTGLKLSRQTVDDDELSTICTWRYRYTVRVVPVATGRSTGTGTVTYSYRSDAYGRATVGVSVLYWVQVQYK